MKIGGVDELHVRKEGTWTLTLYRAGCRLGAGGGEKAAAGGSLELGQSLRRFFHDMKARELNKIDRDILEIRQYAEHQRDVVCQLAAGGSTQAIPEAQKTLEELQAKLQELHARRKAVLQDI